jgi:hypothetical protein
MILGIKEYTEIVQRLNINIIYNGPLWEEGIKGLAEMVKVNLANEDLTNNTSKAIFSVFVEKVTNMLMYSAETEPFSRPGDEVTDVPVGMLVLGHKDRIFFIQTRNAIKNKNIDLIKGRIDHLNTLDKKELRQYQREKLRSEDGNPESMGGGLGLIEIARRATKPIRYEFETFGEGLSYFTMYVEIEQSCTNAG